MLIISIGLGWTINYLDLFEFNDLIIPVLFLTGFFQILVEIILCINLYLKRFNWRHSLINS